MPGGRGVAVRTKGFQLAVRRPHPAAVQRIFDKIFYCTSIKQQIFRRCIFMFKNFIQSAKNFKSTKILCASAIMTAMYVALYAMKLQLTPQLRITFTFIPMALTGWLFGPVPAMAVGLCGDVIGAQVFPSGSFFPGFTVTAVLSGLIYGLCLYRTEGKWLLLRAAAAKFLVNMLMNTLLNAYWLSVITGKGYLVYLSSHFIKNISTLVFEVIVLYFIMKFLSSHGVTKMYK